MQKIATELGIKPASIYFFYKNKEVVFVSAFQRLLEEHFKHMKKIMEEVEDSSIEEIFHSLLRGTVSYHKEREYETMAYISLLTSPPQEIRSFLKSHMENFDMWLLKSLKNSLKRDYPSISEQQNIDLVKQFLLVMDGLFWEINLYDEKTLDEQIKNANRLVELMLRGIGNAK